MEKEDKFPPVLKHTEHYGINSPNDKEVIKMLVDALEQARHAVENSAKLNRQLSQNRHFNTSEQTQFIRAEGVSILILELIDQALFLSKPDGGPDPCDEAREYADAEEWAAQPTDYDMYGPNGPTGHGDECYSDADPGL